jgi:Holliday junction resolvase RusA-like endonuclease
MEVRNITLKRLRLPPKLEIVVWGAPHRRQHIAIIKQYRQMLVHAARRRNIEIPLDGILDLEVLWVDPTSPDHDNLLGCLFRAMDKAVVTDDGHFSRVCHTILWTK